MQGTHTGGLFRVYSMVQSRSPYSAVNINGSFTKEDVPFGVQDFNLKKQFKETKNKITKATM